MVQFISNTRPSTVGQMHPLSSPLLYAQLRPFTLSQPIVASATPTPTKDCTGPEGIPAAAELLDTTGAREEPNAANTSPETDMGSNKERNDMNVITLTQDSQSKDAGIKTTNVENASQSPTESDHHSLSSTALLEANRTTRIKVRVKPPPLNLKAAQNQILRCTVSPSSVENLPKHCTPANPVDRRPFSANLVNRDLKRKLTDTSDTHSDSALTHCLVVVCAMCQADLNMRVLIILKLNKPEYVVRVRFGLSMSFMKAGFKSTLIQPVMQPPEDKCDLMEDFTHYVSIDDRLFEEITCLEFDDEESLDEFASNQAKHRKEDEYEAMNAPEVISIREAQKLLDQLKLFALANARSSGQLLGER
ncbi:unnamed protein product [Echinostoma caproni]|uniref:Neuronal migration protein doublecortin n=1 Tax=Echinostoma caproni TaxID=27848 RepID=A0A183AGL8_9TREM|nr:unnamed protein product [Echinostoma caproni]